MSTTNHELIQMILNTSKRIGSNATFINNEQVYLNKQLRTLPQKQEIQQQVYIYLNAQKANQKTSQKISKCQLTKLIFHTHQYATILLSCVSDHMQNIFLHTKKIDSIIIITTTYVLHRRIIQQQYVLKTFKTHKYPKLYDEVFSINQTQKTQCLTVKLICRIKYILQNIPPNLDVQKFEGYNHYHTYILLHRIERKAILKTHIPLQICKFQMQFLKYSTNTACICQYIFAKIIAILSSNILLHITHTITELMLSLHRHNRHIQHIHIPNKEKIFTCITADSKIQSRLLIGRRPAVLLQRQHIRLRKQYQREP
eukprot:TRINITY_DN3034_c1_g1_i1.p1 TRINITY_DN3034_c1_g1~~TRINITY_DN3034_c1_g1_i1.p1  ORF type:complete len:361 (-),score=-34.82 TRINITY_DN3034_c1_g1_i1:867-1805(-)